MYLYIQSAAAAAAAAATAAAALYRCCCCSSCCLLVLFVIVCRMAIVAGSLNLIPVFYFSSFKHDLGLMYVPLGSTVAFTASICLYYILGNFGHARSQGGVSPPRRSPPCIYIDILPIMTLNFFAFL